MKLQQKSGKTLTDYFYNKATRMKIPLSGTFELSPVCNFSCKMCYIRKSLQEVKQSQRTILNLSDWRKIAKDARDSGMVYLLLTGGEPLLWQDFWTLYDELSEMGFLISINTNGALIDQKVIEHFKDKPPHRINITLYGASDETYQRMCGLKGAFAKVDAAIQSLLDIGITVKLNCSLTPDNSNDLDLIIDYAKKKNTVLSLTTYMFPPVRRDEGMVGKNHRFLPKEAARYLMHYHYREKGESAYQHQLEHILSGSVEPPGLDESCIDPIDGRIRCRAGKASFWISWDGWMMPCGMMPEPKVDVKNQSFDGAWNEITQLSAELKLSGVCDKCPNHSICHPCAAVSYAETGSSSGIPSYMCKMTQEMRRIASQSLNKKK